MQSIQKQSFLDWECLIIDDGGTDNTIEVIAPFLERDNRFQYFKRTEKHQKGLPGCRNCGLDLAKGEFIIFFDDDDIVHPQNLELCVSELSHNEFYFCRYIRDVFFEKFEYNFDYSTDYSSFLIDFNDIERLLRHELPFNSCAVMWKKECFTNNRFEEHLMYAEEWELYSRILSNGFKGISINKCLFYGRKHPQSNTGEYFRHNPIRRASNAEAILLAVNNLKDKQLLSASILRYLLGMAMGFKEYNLFQKIIKSLNLSKSNKLKWTIFYTTFPLRFFIFRMKKRMKSNT